MLDKSKGKRTKAVGLVSGGLDSLLAALILARQNIEVVALNIRMGFDLPEMRSRKKPDAASESDPFQPLHERGVIVEKIDLPDSYLTEALHHPKYGYGKNVNPCVDCHLYMLKLAKKRMEEIDAQFVFTGEVLGQRPKSQQLPQLQLIAKQSGLVDRLLRPLSALKLEPTLPEREGLINRAELYGFHGRNRKPQMELAKEFRIESFPSPGGGCLFTDPHYSKKTRDLWENAHKDELDWNDYKLLRIGRHLRVSPDLKIIAGRDELDNELLEKYAGDRIKVEVRDHPGPLVLIDKSPVKVTDEMLEIAAGIAGRYSDGKDAGNELSVEARCDSETKTIKKKPFTAEEVNRWVIS